MSDISPWLRRWPQALRPGATALDLACGSGRHLRHLLEQGLRVTGVDRDAAALAPLRALPGAEIIEADIESGPWPLAGRQFDLVLVTNYLWRPLLPAIVAAVAPGGWLLYETFASGQERIGRPARPEFLLQPGELLAACQALRIVGYEDGFEKGGGGGGGGLNGVNPRHVQRVAAVRERQDGVYQRYALDGA
ncbi:MAG: class I SAM-dependent methyltransferase [Burkholderiaceae bacterium]